MEFIKKSHSCMNECVRDLNKIYTLTMKQQGAMQTRWKKAPPADFCQMKLIFTLLQFLLLHAAAAKYLKFIFMLLFFIQNLNEIFFLFPIWRHDKLPFHRLRCWI